ncbi:MAG: hypothetical protein LBT40_06570, partial [Deltaproteobacteria bacterium]|nr:hypothetical protein [Deltaproteobacteria bacterium]
QLGSLASVGRGSEQVGARQRTVGPETMESVPGMDLRAGGLLAPRRHEGAAGTGRRRARDRTR